MGTGLGSTRVVPAGATRLRRCLVHQNANAASKASPTIPPTTPPAIAPALDFFVEELVDEAEVDDGLLLAVVEELEVLGRAEADDSGASINRRQMSNQESEKGRTEARFCCSREKLIACLIKYKKQRWMGWHLEPTTTSRYAQ